MNDPYSILGVTRDTDEKDIKKAFKKLAMQHHPDRNDGNDTKFKEINSAYDQIKNGETTQDNYTFRNAGDVADFFRARRPQQFSVTLQIPLRDAIIGGKQYVKLQLSNPIPDTFEINVPPGIRHGESIRYPRLANGIDIIITFIVPPDPIWEVDGLTLIKSTRVLIWDLILGTEIDVTTIDNKTIRLKIPAGTQPNTFMRVRGKGITSRQNMLASGDMLVRIEAIIPDNIPEELLILIKKLKG